MKRHLAIIVVSVLCAASSLYAQGGGAAVPFLLISPDSRANGMGDVGTGIADNIHAMYWNPGGLAYQFDRQATLSYSKWLPQFNADLFYSYAAYSQYVESLQGTVGASFTFMNLGEFTRTNINGEALGVFRSNEFALSLTYATQLSEDFGAGVNVKYIQSNLSQGATSGGEQGGTGSSAAVDLGILWKPSKLSIGGVDLSDRLNVGVNIQNIGSAVTYIAFSDPLPTSFRLGLSGKLLDGSDGFNELTLAADVSKLLVKRDSAGGFDRLPLSIATAWTNPGMETAIGLEYIYAKLISLRAGYFTEPSRLGNRTFLTFGAGVRYDIFSFDFSFINPTEQNHPLANTLRFTLLVNWQNITGKQAPLTAMR
jgi:hypothetical protein